MSKNRNHKKYNLSRPYCKKIRKIIDSFVRNIGGQFRKSKYTVDTSVTCSADFYITLERDSKKYLYKYISFQYNHSDDILFLEISSLTNNYKMIEDEIPASLLDVDDDLIFGTIVGNMSNDSIRDELIGLARNKKIEKLKQLI